MIKFDFMTNESEHRFLQRLSNYSAAGSIRFDDCYIEINTDNNDVSASVKCNEFRMYKINDTEYCYYPSIFSRANLKAKVLCDQYGKTHLKGMIVPHFQQFLSFVIPIILAIIVIALPSFRVNMFINSFYITILLFGISVFVLVHTIMHAAFSCARLKKFLKSEFEEDNVKI